MKQTVSKLEKPKDRRTGKGRVIALSRNIYHLQNKKAYYVESESSDSRYYFVRFEPSSFEWCSCMDYGSNRADRCKHIYAVEYAIRFNTLKEVDKLPEEVKTKKDCMMQLDIEDGKNSSYLDDEYSF